MMFRVWIFIPLAFASSCSSDVGALQPITEVTPIGELDLLAISDKPQDTCVSGRFVIDIDDAMLIPNENYKAGSYFHTAVKFRGAGPEVVSGEIVEGAFGSACGVVSISARCLPNSTADKRQIICTPIQFPIVMSNVRIIVVED